MARQDQYNMKPIGEIGFESARGMPITLIMKGNFVVPRELQDNNGELSLRKVQEFASMMGRDNKTTKCMYSTFPNINSSGEYTTQFSVSWE
jgi:hypothetical protein